MNAEHLPSPPLPPIPVDPRRNIDTRDLLEISRDFFLSQIHPMDPDDLCALDEYDDPDTRRKELEKVRYELRSAQPYFSEVGLVGHCTRLSFQGIVHHAFDEAKRAFQVEQAGCQWELVAFWWERRNVNRAVNIDYRGPTRSLEDRAGWVRSKEAIPLEQHTDYAQVPDYRLHFHLVFADVARGQLTDPAKNSPEGGEGPMSKYARTRLLRDLTESQREARREAVEIVQRYWSQPTLSEQRAPVQLADGDIEALRARIRELEALEEARRPAVAIAGVDQDLPAQPIPDIKPPDEELVAQILHLRQQEQMTPRAIADAIGPPLTESMVKRVLRSHT